LFEVLADMLMPQMKLTMAVADFGLVQHTAGTGLMQVGIECELQVALVAPM